MRALLAALVITPWTQGLRLSRPRPVLTSTARFLSIDHDYFNRPGVWDERDLPSLMDANRRWTERIKLEDPNFFEEIKRGHAPKILWIGCSDARVPANEIIGEPPGSVFVHRNIANQVVSTDFNCMSVLQYAVEILRVKHIIVCGHYDCGGIRAATEMMDHRSPLENWLRHIRDTYRLHRNELDAIPDTHQRRRRLVELNVIEQCLNIFKTAVVQKRRIETHQLMQKTRADEEAGLEVPAPVHFHEPRVHAFVYEPTSGVLTKLDVDFREYLRDLRSVYDLYRLEPEAASTETRDDKVIKSILDPEI